MLRTYEGTVGRTRCSYSLQLLLSLFIFLPTTNVSIKHSYTSACMYVCVDGGAETGAESYLTLCIHILYGSNSRERDTYDVNGMCVR